VTAGGVANSPAGCGDGHGGEVGPHQSAGGGGDLLRYHVFVQGLVQGVWFRESTRHEALALGVSGWVRNLADGRVEAVFEGPAEPVEALLAWTEHGPVHARVDSLERRSEAVLGERGFSIL
jgi:acylphosphatase